MLQVLELVLSGSPQRGCGEAEIHTAAIFKDTHWSSSWWTTGAWIGPAEPHLLSDHNSQFSPPVPCGAGNARGVRSEVEAGKVKDVVLIFASVSYYQNLF